jgi:Mrp family chromosome partitioning ATPase
MRQALMTILAGVFFGLLAAVAAHKLDPRVYIATDVERVLGFAPMAMLPDFTEVSDRVVEEHMLRLAAGIEYARQQGNLKSCIFTGTGPGAGVTSVVTRVREMLEAMGRSTVLVDASGNSLPPPPANSGGLDLQDTSSQLATRRGSSSTALLQQLAEETETGEESLVLTDTAPLTVSAETEYLARMVDCAIIVIESGVTTRSQLREVAHSLQKLDVAAVGFVLNRVGLKKADPAFRRSVQGIERHLRAQGRSFKEELEEIQKQKKLQSPDAYLFYVSEWKAANPEGDVDAAIAEAKRLGYEVVEQ